MCGGVAGMAGAWGWFNCDFDCDCDYCDDNPDDMEIEN